MESRVERENFVQKVQNMFGMKNYKLLFSIFLFFFFFLFSFFLLFFLYSTVIHTLNVLVGGDVGRKLVAADLKEECVFFLFGTTISLFFVPSAMKYGSSETLHKYEIE